MSLVVRAEARTYLRGKGNGNGNGNSNSNGNGNSNSKGKGNGQRATAREDAGANVRRLFGTVEVGWRIDAACVGFGRMDVRIVRVPLAHGIAQDVVELVVQIVLVGDAMGVVAVLPDLAGGVLSYRKREAALDELCAAFDGVIRRGREDCVQVVRHDHKSMKLKSVAVAITEKNRDEALRHFGSLEESTAVVGDRGDGVGLRVLPHAKGYPRG
jgi:hypothetical protein